jgi:hypothetical protein
MDTRSSGIARTEVVIPPDLEGGVARMGKEGGVERDRLVGAWSRPDTVRRVAIACTFTSGIGGLTHPSL